MGGSHLRPEFHQVGSSMQADRVSPRIPSLPENTSGTHLPGPPPFPGQMGPSNQPSRPTAVISAVLLFSYLVLEMTVGFTFCFRPKIS